MAHDPDPAPDAFDTRAVHAGAEPDELTAAIEHSYGPAVESVQGLIGAGIDPDPVSYTHLTLPTNSRV